MGDDAADAATLRARLRDDHEPGLPPNLPLAPAHRTGFRRSAWGCAGPVARLAGFFARNLDVRFRAARRFLERDLQVVAQVCAALRTGTTAAAEQVAEAEHVAEDVGEVE